MKSRSISIAEPRVAAREAGGALDDDTLRQVAELNLRGLRVLRASLDADAPQPVAVAVLEAAWRALDDAALQRLATCPWLLFDAHFDDVARWRRAFLPGVHEAHSGGAPCMPAAAPVDEAARFRRLVLHYAWHLARAAPLAAALVLGMPAETRALLRTQGLNAIDAFAAEAGDWVRLRWDHLPAAWAPLLQAAAAGDAAALHQAQLHGLQRIAGACRAASGRAAGL
jgi:hypothetical protein